jgi:hypothetical protein
MPAHLNRRVFNARLAVPVVFLLSIPDAFTLDDQTPSWLSRWFSSRTKHRTRNIQGH